MEQRMARISALLALVIGAMAIFAGGQVLLGKVPDYYVIDWLPTYNFTLGILSVFVTAILIWKCSPYALPAAVATLSLHVLVMLILLIGYSDVVANDSIIAMTIRIASWLIILPLLFYASRQKNAASV
jgi:hypothetical protein